MVTVLLEGETEIPLGISDLADFRRWARSDAFPQRGRIDYVHGRIEVEMSPEDLFTHGTLQTEVAAAVNFRVRQLDLGHVFVAETRVSSAPGDVSAEPDVVVVAYAAEDDGRVHYVPKASHEPGRFAEIEGAPDLIVEIVSDSSQQKDAVRLPTAYYHAGVREFWLIDARGSQLEFQISHRGPDAFHAVQADAEGYQRSHVLQSDYRLERQRHRRGHWIYRL